VAARAITIAVLAMGGEGGGVMADWIVDLAEHSGYRAQATSVPGVAQRTGSTIYYIELFPEEAIRAAGQEPVLALMPVPGELDVVIASELMEAGRAVQRGLVTPDRTTLISSTHRVYSMTERTAPGDGRVDSAALLDAARAAARHFVEADFAALAQASGSVISAALFGALAASAALPFPCNAFEDAIRRSGVGVDASLEAFRAGTCFSVTVPPVNTSPDCDAVLQAGIARLTDYQDVERLAPIRGLTLLTETARYLALWMSYEDAIRVADLKIRAERFARIRQEARATSGQVIKIHDYVYPRVGEIADILPARLGRWLLSSRVARGLVERFTSHGKIVETTSLRGFLKLRMLAALRRWRRGSLRFSREQQAIEEWLGTVESLAEHHYALACEVAQAPRVLKGYGDTHANGWRAYEAAMAALPELLPLPDAAARFKKLVIIE